MNAIEAEWLKASLEIRNLDEIASILNFVIYWNLFEHIIFSDRYAPSKIDSVYEDYENKFEPIKNSTEEMLKFFKERYSRDGEFTAKFHTLNLRIPDNMPLVKKCLSGGDDSSTSREKFVVVITIIGRFRNNLFHGLKTPNEIRQQNVVFEKINKYIMEILDAMRSQNY